jgi:hypothetical protein
MICRIEILSPVVASGIYCRVVRCKSADVSEEHVPSIYGVGKGAKQETSCCVSLL